MQDRNTILQIQYQPEHYQEPEIYPLLKRPLIGLLIGAGLGRFVGLAATLTFLLMSFLEKGPLYSVLPLWATIPLAIVIPFFTIRLGAGFGLLAGFIMNKAKTSPVEDTVNFDGPKEYNIQQTPVYGPNQPSKGNYTPPVLSRPPMYYQDYLSYTLDSNEVPPGQKVGSLSNGYHQIK
jgi:hypothetical protein